VAVEPSLWWDDQYLLKVLDTAFNSSIPDLSRKSLFVGIANTMRPGFNMDNLFSDTTKSTIHLRSLFNFVKDFDAKSGSGIKSEWNYYENDDHVSVVPISIYDALRFIFRWYKLSIPHKFYVEPYSLEYQEELMNLITHHFDTISYYFGNEVLPPQETIRNLGFEFQYFWQKPEYAFVLHQLNLKNFPDNKDVYETMGDFYLMEKDTLKAIEFIETAIGIGGEENSKHLIETLDMLKPKNK
jgi:hypothetical protein